MFDALADRRDVLSRRPRERRQHTLAARTWPSFAALPLRRASFAWDSEREWRRRESNPRPRENPRETLHAYPLLFSRAQREEAAQNRQAPDPVNLAVRRRAAV